VQAGALGASSVDSSGGGWALVVVMILIAPGGVLLWRPWLRAAGGGFPAAALATLPGGLAVLLVDRATRGGGLLRPPLTGLCTDGPAMLLWLRAAGGGFPAAALATLPGGLAVLLVDRATRGEGLLRPPLTGLCTDGPAMLLLARGGGLVVWRFCLVAEPGKLLPGVRVVE
jgi:hypothetical protein